VEVGRDPLTMRFVSGDDRREVTLRETRDGLVVTVDGIPSSPRVSQIAPGAFVLQDGLRSETFLCVRDGEALHVFWRGAVHELREEREGGRTAERQASGVLEAPMPGTVIAVRVAVGQAVKKGEDMLVIEAMKMESSLRAPRDGIVKSVSAKPGDRVSPGVVLVELA
jgi:acetyl/propionyl-CoA carboxylase alpha subunit